MIADGFLVGTGAGIVGPSPTPVSGKAARPGDGCGGVSRLPPYNWLSLSVGCAVALARQGPMIAVYEWQAGPEILLQIATDALRNFVKFSLTLAKREV